MAQSYTGNVVYDKQLSVVAVQKVSFIYFMKHFAVCTLYTACVLLS